MRGEQAKPLGTKFPRHGRPYTTICALFLIGMVIVGKKKERRTNQTMCGEILSDLIQTLILKTRLREFLFTSGVCNISAGECKATNLKLEILGDDGPDGIYAPNQEHERKRHRPVQVLEPPPRPVTAVVRRPQPHGWLHLYVFVCVLRVRVRESLRAHCTIFLCTDFHASSQRILLLAAR